MSTEMAPSIFDSFNARALNPWQVAKTFVPPYQYQKLCLRRHSVLIGPRGSGKTTLLKMLTPAALNVWNHQLSNHYRNQIDFTGVFIPTDLTWREQIDSLGGGRLDPKITRVLSKATVTTHVLRSLMSAIITRQSAATAGIGFRKLSLAKAQESALARQIAEAWLLQPPLFSFAALKHALSSRLLRVRQLAGQLVELHPSEISKLLGSRDYLFLDFIECIAFAIEVLDDTTGESDARWALMFDELELAPEWLQGELMSSMRSRSDRLIFKLALSPYSGGIPLANTSTSAGPDQDYEPISLWYAEKRNSYPFCRDLWFQMLQERGLDLVEPAEVLGRSVFETTADEWRELGNAYSPSGRIGRRFMEAAKRDISFRKYLATTELDPAHLDTLSGNERAASVRKIAPLVAVREFYRGADIDGRTVMRSRKRPTLFAGADSLFAISEGNPRWFIAIIGRLLDNLSGNQSRITESMQATEMKHAADRFAAMLSILPVTAGSSSKAARLFDIISQIARYFHRRAVVDEFSPEPPLTFVVDHAIPEDVLSILGVALNAGAIVYVPDDSSRLILDDCRGSRFRISYLLTPLFGLPIRLGPAISLSTILFKPKPISDLEQLTLMQ